MIEPATNFDQYAVAESMAEGVVDVLELVQVEQRKRNRFVPLQVSFEFRYEHRPIG